MPEFLTTAEFYKTREEAAEAFFTVRDGISSLLSRGTYGSAYRVDAEVKGHKRITLPSLLGYSRDTVAHAGILSSVYSDLQGPTVEIGSILDLPAVSQNLKRIQPGREDMPFLMLMQQKVAELDFVIGAGENARQRWKSFPELDGRVVKTMINANFNAGDPVPFWEACYTFDRGFMDSFRENDEDGALEAVGSVLGSSASIEPAMHRRFLLNFVLTFKDVGRDRGFWERYLANNLQLHYPEYTSIEMVPGQLGTVTMRTNTDDLLHRIYHDASSFAAQLNLDQAVKYGMMSSLVQQEKDQLEEVQFVKLGLLKMGKQIAHVYSAAERPLVEPPGRGNAPARWARLFQVPALFGQTS